MIIATENLYSKINIVIDNFKIEKESVAYNACSFEINNKNILYREAKVTPTKIGLFVSIWKRNNTGITEPFNVDDDIDLVVISCRNGEQFGQFVFPKNVLVEKKIFTYNNIEGKRGIRVYPPWAITENKQAKQTQAWQLEYFLKLHGIVDVEKAKRLYDI